MRRKLIGTVGVVACAAAIVAAIGVGSTSASPGQRLGETLVVIQSPPRQQYVDLADPGPSPGDLLVFASTLASQAGNPTGDLHIACTQNFDQVAVCVGIFDLSGRGKISVDASPVFPSPTVGMVTGGTGEFQNVRGEAHIDPQPDGTTKITFHLLG
ncbi:MAG TPA: hypothetical protein VFA46_05015 [Actinomycetes bacterium]|jgi:hypothetical protein|nr:hypothetical protein [Actinomycetes bacterium]